MTYLIKSKLTGFVLEADDGGTQPGAAVVPRDHHGRDSQVWYDDPVTGTIRLKASHFCLDTEGEKLCVRPFQKGDQNQQWIRDGQVIRNRIDHNKVLDIWHSSSDRGAKIGSYHFNGGTNQSWEFEYNPSPYTSVHGVAYPSTTGSSGYPGYLSAGQGPYPHPAQGQHTYPYPVARREFFIVSDMNQKVLDIERGNVAAGTKIVVYQRSGPPKRWQLWYMDEQGCIRSALNDMVFSNGENAQSLKMQPAGSGDPRSQWKVEGKTIVNRVGECLDIKGKSNYNGAVLLSFTYKTQSNQHWHIDYIN